jgi:hypothetical protein
MSNEIKKIPHAAEALERPGPAGCQCADRLRDRVKPAGVLATVPVIEAVSPDRQS